MIANDLFTSCFGIVAAGDEENIVRVAKAAVNAGFAVVLNDPGTKKPTCTLTARQAKTENTKVQNEAKDKGDPNWSRRRHACGIAHAITEPKKVDTIVRRMVTERGHINLGLEVGKSRLLVVDVDTAEQRAAFLKEWSEAAGEDMSERMPTVLSPGKVLRNATDSEDRWVHKDGGHFWFSLPEDLDLSSLPGSGVMTADAEWVAITANKQVLVPPSVRAEGPYQLVGQVEPAPAWLITRIKMAAAAQEERRNMHKARGHFAEDPIDIWSAATPWAELLEPDGWNNTGLPDTCDCMIWTRPGDDVAHSKSATAHELGCTLYEMDAGHGPLYLWTDNPPDFLVDAVRASGSKAVTKLSYIAWRDHAGEMSKAMADLDLTALHIDELWDPWEQPQPSTNGVPPPDEGDDTEPTASAETDGEEKFETPAERIDFLARLKERRLPPYLRGLVDRRWTQDFTDQEYRKLVNAGNAEEIRERLQSSIDRLHEIEVDDEELPYRIRGLWLQGQTVLISARFKAGKSTMVINVVRSLVDGEPFLGYFEVTPVTGTVFIVNAEMTRRQFNRWILDSPIVHKEKVAAFHVREAGPASGDIMDETRRDELIETLNVHNAQVLILDPLNPLFSASGLNEDKSAEIAPWFTALADITERSSVTEVFLVHHFGHSGERGRGSSKLMDAPDALWTYTIHEGRDKDRGYDDDDLLGAIDAPTAPRFLSAMGRDVDLPKTLVQFDPATRVLSVELVDGVLVGPRAAFNEFAKRRIEAMAARITAEVLNAPGITQNALYDLIKGNRKEFNAARDKAAENGYIEVVDGPRTSKYHYPPNGSPTTETN